MNRFLVIGKRFEYGGVTFVRIRSSSMHCEGCAFESDYLGAVCSQTLCEDNSERAIFAVEKESNIDIGDYIEVISIK